MASHPIEAAVLAAAEPRLQAALADGRATVEFEPLGDDGEVPATLTIEPAKPTACPLTLAFDVPRELYVSIGRHGTSIEIWEQTDESFAAVVAELTSAVIDGRYVERVRVTEDGDLEQAKGRFRDSRLPATHYCRVGAGKGTAWQTLTYDPY